MQELVVIFVVALIVFGPKRLPELGRAIGKVMGQIKSTVSDVKTEVEREIRLAETELDIEELPAWKKRDAGPGTETPPVEKAGGEAPEAEQREETAEDKPHDQPQESGEQGAEPSPEEEDEESSPEEQEKDE